MVRKGRGPVISEPTGGGKGNRRRERRGTAALKKELISALSAKKGLQAEY